MSTNEVVKAVRQSPAPLLNETLQLGLIWSAKSGCTFGTKWFLEQCGLLETGLLESAWIHDYRSKTFYSEPVYTGALVDSQLCNYRFLRLVRNPFSRCVSAYLAFCMACHTQRSGPHEGFLNAIEEHLGREIGRSMTFSFREFIAFLETLDIGSCDIHVRAQTHPIERLNTLSGVTVVRLEESQDRISEFERTEGLKVTNLSVLRQSPHHATKGVTQEFVGDVSFTNTVEGTSPNYEHFYDGGMWQRVAELYREDCDRYGYNTRYQG